MAILTKENIEFDMEMVRKNAPIVTALYESSPDLTKELNEQFYYPTIHSHDMPFCCFALSETQHIAHAAETVYGALVDSLELLFGRYEHKIGEFFGCDFLSRYPQFVEYAKYTYEHNHEAIYGRFDLAFDFQSGRVKGVYEFNGDTPVMLFESVVMQNEYGKGEGHNYWQENLTESINRVINPFSSKNIAVIVDLMAIEDALTGEYLKWAFDSFGSCHLHDVNDLEYDFALRDKPFHVQGQQFDYIYMLMPWEEMVENSPEIISDWRKWADSVRFFEPAWRWFVSNKGSMAWLWWLMNSGLEPDFKEQYGEALEFLIPTFNKEPDSYSTYVRKPIMGRLSSNIAIMNRGEVIHETDGGYADCPVVYQEFLEPGKLGGRSAYAIVGVWMSPYGNESLVMGASTICIRECDDMVTNISNERFIPHLVVG